MQSRKRILVVDDEVLLAKIIARALEPEYAVVCLTSSREALAHVKVDAEFDLILCDMNMPAGGAAELVAGLEEHAPNLVPRFALMTGGSFTPAAKSLIARLKAPVLDKPFTIDDVRTFVTKTLGSA